MRLLLLAQCLLCFSLVGTCDVDAQEDTSTEPVSALDAIARSAGSIDEPTPPRRLASIVQTAFRAVHDGWSCDEVLLDDELNRSFLARCRELSPDADPAACNWALLNLRKAGKLGAVATRRRVEKNDDYEHAAEIAARFLQDKYEQSIDRLLCDLDRRAEFDRVAQSVAPETEPRQLRKAALAIRKSRRLQPELVARVADWDREVVSLAAADIVADGKLVPDKPGIYIFRDPTGYLYVGESSSLRQRVTQHLNHSDRKSLAHYLWSKGNENVTVELHVFPKDSPAKEKTKRRAYESELIRSRKPKLNLAP